jgi:hypothetical protein
MSVKNASAVLAKAEMWRKRLDEATALTVEEERLIATERAAVAESMVAYRAAKRARPIALRLMSTGSPASLA